MYDGFVPFGRSASLLRVGSRGSLGDVEGVADVVDDGVGSSSG